MERELMQEIGQEIYDEIWDTFYSKDRNCKQFRENYGVHGCVEHLLNFIRDNYINA